jgi:hypothetical protein
MLPASSRTRKDWLCRTSPKHKSTVLTEQSMDHFRVTGITAYPGNGEPSSMRSQWQRMKVRAQPDTMIALNYRLTQYEVKGIRLNTIGGVLWF